MRTFLLIGKSLLTSILRRVTVAQTPYFQGLEKDTFAPGLIAFYYDEN